MLSSTRRLLEAGKCKQHEPVRPHRNNCYPIGMARDDYDDLVEGEEEDHESLCDQSRVPDVFRLRQLHVADQALLELVGDALDQAMDELLVLAGILIGCLVTAHLPLTPLATSIL